MAEHGVRWVRGAAEPGADLAGLETRLRLDDIRAAQTGLIADMDLVADAIYHRAG